MNIRTSKTVAFINFSAADKRIMNFNSIRDRKFVFELLDVEQSSEYEPIFAMKYAGIIIKLEEKKNNNISYYANKYNFQEERILLIKGNNKVILPEGLEGIDNIIVTGDEDMISMDERDEIHRFANNCVDEQEADDDWDQVKEDSTGNKSGNLSQEIRRVAESLTELRINSISDYIQQLEDIADEIDKGKEYIKDPNILKDILLVLHKMLVELQDRRNIRLVIAGAIGLTVGGMGVAGATVFALSVAAMKGEGAFLEAIKKYFGSKAGE